MSGPAVAAAARVAHVLRTAGIADRAVPMARYMKGVSTFAGVPSVERRALAKVALEGWRPASPDDIAAFARALWAEPERECGYVAADELRRHHRLVALPLCDELITTDISAAMARDRALPDNWLNDAVKSFVPDADPNARALLDLPGLAVVVASPRYLLAMKLLASRIERDEDDIRLLLALCGIGTVDGALELVADLYGTRPIEPKVRYLVAELLDHPVHRLPPTDRR